MKDKILLFIPAYNCENQLPRVLESLKGEALSYIDTVLVINNRSTDKTEEAALIYKEENRDFPLKVLRNDENYGLGGSHKVAFEYAIRKGYDYCIVLHGDDQGNFNDFIPMLKKGIYKKYDCVLGARFMFGSKLFGYSLFRTFGNIVYNFLFAMVTRRRIFDLGSGLNLYSTRMLENRFYQKFPDNLTFNYCMVMALDYYGQKERFYPVTWKETDQVSNVKMGSQAVNVLKMLFKYMKNRETIKTDYREKKIESYLAEEIR
ncbi:MAG: glycosyltransferase family 2 protein [Lachnospiraceae bacterium]|nr:glycosyltransferase family 2 protein [Lachnospiraceae bacterium]